MVDFGSFDNPAPEGRRDRRAGRHADHGRPAQQGWKRFRKNIFVTFFIDLLVVVASALVLSLLIKTFLIRSFFIPSGSMEQTLLIDDRIIVNELVPDLVPLQHGDVVVFQDPGLWLGSVNTNKVDFLTQTTDWFLSAFGITAPDSKQHLVKRVIGLPGDHVVCCSVDHKLQINGTTITEPYIAENAKPSEIDFDVTVPADSYWVMGDNRGNSADSRYHMELASKGFVNKKFVVGRAFLLSWPFSRFKWLDNYPDVFKNVPHS